MTQHDYFPEIDGPQSRELPGGRRILAKGGGGGSGSPYYANQDKLFGTQADIAQNLYNQYTNMAPGLLQNSQNMVNDAMSGALGEQMRGRAAYDANQGIASSNNDAIRKLTSYGAVGDPSSGRFADTVNRNALGGAQVRAGAMNQANMSAEDQKWNRNAGAYGQIAGMGTGAMQGMGSAGAGYGAAAAAQGANAAANAQGFGKFGGQIAGLGMGYADGGEVKKKGLKLADGGPIPVPRTFQNYLKPVDWRNQATMSGGGGGGSGLGQVAGALAMGAAPVLIGHGIKQYIAPAVKDAISGLKSSSPIGSTKDYIVPPYAEDAPKVVADQVVQPDQLADAIKANSVDGLYDAYAKGGPVKKKGLCLAAGGFAAPISGQYESDPNRFRGQAPSAADAYMERVGSGAVARAANPTTYTKAAGDIAKLQNASDAQDALGAAQQNYDATLAAAGTASTGADTADVINSAKAVSDASTAADAASKAAEGAGASPYGAVVKGVADIAAGRDAGEAAADAAAGYAGAEAGATIGSAVGPVGTVVGGLLGGLAGGALFADGGQPKRANYKPGGKVTGPGTETSDDIPAWLSDGEFVLNAEAVKMVGKDKLEKINEKGLERREGNADEPEAKGLKQGLKLAGGGFLGGNLGIALGAGTDKFDEMQKDAENKRRYEEAMTLQRAANDRADEGLKLQQAADARAGEEFGMRKQDRDTALRDRRVATLALQAAELAKNGDFEGLGKAATNAYGDGNTYGFTKSQDGKQLIMTATGQDGKPVGSVALASDPEAVKRYVLAQANPSLVAGWDHDDSKLNRQIGSNELIHKRNNETQLQIAGMHTAAQLKAAGIHAGAMAGRGVEGKPTEAEYGALLESKELGIKARQARSAGNITLANELELKANDALKNVRPSVKFAMSSGTSVASQGKAPELPKELRDEYAALQKERANFETNVSGYDPTGFGIIGKGSREYNDVLRRIAAIEKASGQYQQGLGSGFDVGVRGDPLGYAPSGGPGAPKAIGTQPAEKVQAKGLLGGLPEPLSSKDGKDIYTWDDYKALRDKTKAMEGGGQGATSPDYWKLKELLDRADYRKY